MVRSPRTLALLVALLLGVAACGVEGGDEAADRSTGSTTATTAAPDEPTDTEPEAPDAPEAPDDDEPTTVPSDVVDQLTDTYVELGLTEEEASCLANALADDIDEIDPSDPAALMDVINQCDIPMSRLMELGGGMSGDPEEAFETSMAAGLRSSGLSDDEADCVAAAYVDEFGMDPSGSSDPEALLPMFRSCGVDPSSLGN
jgi:hypothetical protein